MRDAILDFRKSGKQAIAYLEYGGRREYFLATACDRIFLAPTSPLDLSGLASYALFLRGTLDKIGAYPDMLHIGDYKTAPNQLTEKTFTPAHREMAESLNTRLLRAAGRRRWPTAGRRATPTSAALVDDGPFLPEDALRAGLVDDVAYEDQLDDKGKVPLGNGEADRRSRRVRPRSARSRSAWAAGRASPSSTRRARSTRAAAATTR